MQKMADGVGKDDIVADVGTDHGYIPIWLIQNEACRDVILADINSGPLEKARVNIAKYIPDRSFDLRQGSGISVLKQAEADTIIIAGMGGILIRDILSDDLEKTKSFSKFILQPRNHSDVLRRWIGEIPWLSVTDESLAKEAGKLCEIITVENSRCAKEIGEREAEGREVQRLQNELDISEQMVREIPLQYFIGKKLYAHEFLQNKIKIEQAISRRIVQNGITDSSKRRLEESQARLEELKRISSYFYER